jgi:hypothetical protein
MAELEKKLAQEKQKISRRNKNELKEEKIKFESKRYQII